MSSPILQNHDMSQYTIVAIGITPIQGDSASHQPVMKTRKDGTIRVLFLDITSEKKKMKNHSQKNK